MRSLLATSALALLLAAPNAGCKEAEARTQKVGDRLQAFIVQNCEDEAKYCQVCKFGGQPTIMAVGELGDASFEKDRAVQEAVVDGADEVSQLKNTIQDLRNQLESQQIHYEDKIMEMERSAGDEKAQLTDTISVLRDKLEEK